MDISEIVKEEVFNYSTNQYRLTKVNGAVFKRDGLIYDGKGYYYNYFTNKTMLLPVDSMIGFAKIIQEETEKCDILYRLDERLSVPECDYFDYTGVGFAKFYGPQFEFDKPLLLRPSGKDYLWGGSRLNDEFEKNIDLTPLAETWECSTHPDGPSYVVGGAFDGQELAEVLRAHPEYLGERHKGENTLPILIKFIDAKKDLSVQVHPTDAYAQEHENGQLGKTEMWYVLDAGREARLVYGLKQNCTKAEMRRAIADGTVMKYLQKVPIHKDDLFFIQAGTVHAIGAGALVAEIQENSNLTYRLYDYDRVGKDGKKRELHIDKALDVANLKSSAEPKQPLRVLKYRQGVASELLTRCKYFEVYRMIVNTERRQKVHYRADEIAFRVLLCVNGCGTISYEGGNLPFYKGDCIFVPADSEVLTIHGQAQFLDVRG